MTGKNPDPPEVIQTASQDQTSTPKGKWRWAFNILLCVIFIAVGIAGANYIKKTTPKARKRPPAKIEPLVVTKTVSPTQHQVVVTAMGTVIPAREMTLKSRAAGEVVQIHPEFIEGGYIKKGTEIIKIDDQDHKLAIARRESAIASSEYTLKLEMGYQDVAKREWELLKGNQPADEKDIELALRKPHLAKAKADLAAAKAELKQAQLDLSRTTIRAPFNAVIRSKNVEIGSQVSTQDQLAELVGTDLYWIRVSIPVERLTWVRIPRADDGPGSEVRVLYRNGFHRQGKVIKLLGDLETEGRMARILVAVKDPLDMESSVNGQPPLLLGEYVRVEIEGRMLENVYRIPRSALRDATNLWLVDDGNHLEIRPVQTVWRDTDTVLLREGLEPGDRLIISDLSKPVAGMPVRTEAAGAGMRPEGQAEKTKQGG